MMLIRNFICRSSLQNYKISSPSYKLTFCLNCSCPGVLGWFLKACVLRKCPNLRNILDQAFGLDATPSLRFTVFSFVIRNWHTVLRYWGQGFFFYLQSTYTCMTTFAIWSTAEHALKFRIDLIFLFLVCFNRNEARCVFCVTWMPWSTIF